MISSMTGFGQAVAEADGVIYTVEIRSVNNRYFKVALRLPDIAASFEGEIEKLHRELIHRGTVSYFLRMKNVSGQALFDIDENTLLTYIKRLKKLLPENEDKCSIDLASLLTLPGIVQPVIPDADRISRMKQTVIDLTASALKQLMQNRLNEGKDLADDLLKNCKKIRDDLESVRKRKDDVVLEYHQRLKKRVGELLAQAQLAIDSDQLAREVAIFADRSDIAEELTRLESHLTQFEQICKTGEHVGRRLDFIAQEMLREANTIASKASDAAIQQSVIDIKCFVDRIKEQVQNVE